MLGIKLNKLKARLLSIVLLVMICNLGKGQETSPADNPGPEGPDIVQVHSPHKAAMYSALVPGLGQIYNKKYWKLPIILGATGVIIYSFDNYNDLCNKYKNAYADMNSGKIDNFENVTDPDRILAAKEEAQRYRDLNVILLAAVYLLNIVDATVDAHLFNYKISNDLSFNIQPAFQQPNGPEIPYGLAIQINF